ncbi:hypothetical protein [Arthrobacter sp. Ld5]|uniref:hypothetical protein n=1 Tax=Arthrobacter sp. Ld5 TaxID=649152 RepID=UPI003EB76C16
MQQWMWVLPGVPLAIAGYAVLFKINKRKSGTNTRRLYLIIALILLAMFALIFIAIEG